MTALELFKILFFKDINIFYMLLVFVLFILLLSISGNFIARILLEDKGVLFYVLTVFQIQGVGYDFQVYI